MPLIVIGFFRLLLWMCIINRCCGWGEGEQGELCLLGIRQGSGGSALFALAVKLHLGSVLYSHLPCWQLSRRCLAWWIFSSRGTMRGGVVAAVANADMLYPNWVLVGPRISHAWCVLCVVCLNRPTYGLSQRWNECHNGRRLTDFCYVF